MFLTTRWDAICIIRHLTWRLCHSSAMKFLAVIAFLSATISFGDALRCYHCSSKESWDQCTPSKAEKVTCPAGYEMCIKMHTNISYQDGRPHYKSFLRNCYTREPAMIQKYQFSILVELQRMPVLMPTVTSTAAMMTSAMIISAVQAQLRWSAFFWPYHTLFSLSFAKRWLILGDKLVLFDN